MTREEAMLKLLALEPETRDQIIMATGWPAQETCSVLDSLVRKGAVRFKWNRWGPESAGRYQTVSTQQLNG